MTLGAIVTMAKSTNPEESMEVMTLLPPSTMTDSIPSAASFSNRTAKSTLPPASSSTHSILQPTASRARALALRESVSVDLLVVAMIGRTQSGDDARRLNNGVLSLESRTTGVGCLPSHNLTVSDGSSLMTVCTPTTGLGFWV